MSTGGSVDARSRLEALIGVAASQPLPAERVIPLLREIQTDDAESLGRLAYRALTGVAPAATGEALQRPDEVMAGFPVFAAEVLARAIAGPDERRPTPQALMVVLETVPSGLWPARRAVELPAVEAEAPPVEEAPAGEDALPADDFYQVVAPARAVPRFEPLEGAGDLPSASPDPDQPRRDLRRRQRVAGPSGQERLQTLVMVAVLVVLVVLMLLVVVASR